MSFRGAPRLWFSRSFRATATLLLLPLLPDCAFMATQLLPKQSSLHTESDVTRDAGETIATGPLREARAVPISFSFPQFRFQVLGRFECVRASKQERFRIQHEKRTIPKAAHAMLAAEAAVAIVGAVGLVRLVSDSIVGETEATIYTLSLPFVPLVTIDLAALSLTRHRRGPAFETKVGEDLREIERFPCAEEQPVTGWEVEIAAEAGRTDDKGLVSFSPTALGGLSLSSRTTVPLQLHSRGEAKRLELALPDDWLKPSVALLAQAPPEGAVLQEGSLPLRIGFEIVNQGLIPLPDVVIEVTGPPDHAFVSRPAPLRIPPIAQGKSASTDLEFSTRQPVEHSHDITYTVIARRVSGQTLAVAPLTIALRQRALPSFRAWIRTAASHSLSTPEAELVVEIANEGPGVARNVKVEVLSPEDRSSSFFALSKNPFDTIGDIHPGESVPARFFVRAGRTIPAAGLSVRIRETGAPRAVETVLDLPRHGGSP